MHAYLELHIEQGDRLQTANCTIGIVTGSEYNCFANIECFGANGHAQATPMTQRVNALGAAAELIAAIERIGRAHAPAGSAGVAVLDVWPNNASTSRTTPGLTYAATHPDRAGMAAIRDEIAACASAIALETGVRIEVDTRPTATPSISTQPSPPWSLRLPPNSAVHDGAAHPRRS